MPKRSLAEVKAEIFGKQKQLANRLKRIEAREKTADRKKDTRRKIVVGAAAIALRDNDPSFAAKFAAHLDRVVTREADRQVIADLLPGAAQSSKAA